MRVCDIIYKKREGRELSGEEIGYLVKNYTAGKIPDYQMSAWAMAVYFQGMSSKETAILSLEMAQSGSRIDLSSIPGTIIDKHSTGGVGDSTTLVLTPLVASCGVPVAKMSGKGLGHTGGTIDKLESIPGFNTELDEESFIKNVKNIGVAISGQTADLAPADKKLYALRDVTATVESIPLIASSIMSKKLAGGADGIVLDVKTGSGAFMKKYDEAKKLAETMVEIGDRADKEITAVISEMNQPLGKAVGNSLEVKEAIQTLKDNGPEDLKELCFNLGSCMLILAGKVNNDNEAYDYVKKNLEKGKALDKFKELIQNQDGNPEVINDLSLLPQADNKIKIKSEVKGYVKRLNAEQIGLTSMRMGAGREKKEEDIDPAVGIWLNKKIGDKIEKGEVLAELYLNDLKLKKFAIAAVRNSFSIKKNKPKKTKLIKEIV